MSFHIFSLLYLNIPGDVKSQATPTEAHSVIESRPGASEPASHGATLHYTTTTITPKTSLASGLGKNSLGLSAQPIGASSYIKHTASTSQHLSSGLRFVTVYSCV